MRDLRDAPDYRAPSPTGRGLSFGGAREGGRRNIMYTFILLDSDNTASTGNTALFFFDDMISAGMGYISTAAGPGQGQEPDSRFPGALRRTCPVRTQ